MPKNVTVRFSEHEYLAGEFNVLERLRAISDAEVRHKQSLIAAGGFKLQYAIDDVPGDAFDTLMAGALTLSETLRGVYAA